MKKLILAVLLFTFSQKASSQNLEGITCNLVLRAGDWAFLMGKLHPFSDSAGLQRARRLRDTVLLANPANYNTNVRFNSIPAELVFRFYITVKTLPETLYERVGTNISTQIKAIVNTPLQNAISAFDAESLQQFQYIRNLGKNIVMDN